MRDAKREMIDALKTIARIFFCVLIIVIAIRANSQDAPPPPPPDYHPAYGPHHISTLTVESYVPDVPKLEQRVVDILRAADPTLTLADARAKLRINGKTDVARCLELLIIYAVDAPVQFEAMSTTVANEHPQ